MDLSELAWGNELVGLYSTGILMPKMEQCNACFHVGLFKETIPKLWMVGTGRPFAYASIDCEL